MASVHFFLGKCAFKRNMLKNDILEQNRVNWPLLQDQLRQTLLELSLISGGSWTNSWLSLSIIIKWGSSAPPPPGSARGLERGVTINSRAGRLKSEQSASMHHSLYGHFSLNVWPVGWEILLHQPFFWPGKKNIWFLMLFLSYKTFGNWEKKNDCKYAYKDAKTDVMQFLKI